MHYVYFLWSQKLRKIYKGRTDDLQKRVRQHKSGQVQSTRDMLPLEFAGYEAFKKKEDAVAREAYFKTGWGRRHLKKMFKHYLKDKS